MFHFAPLLESGTGKTAKLKKECIKLNRGDPMEKGVIATKPN